MPKYSFGGGCENCPCNGCKDRKAECHDTCSIYKEWSSKRSDELKSRNMKKKLDYMTSSYDGRHRR